MWPDDVDRLFDSQERNLGPEDRTMPLNWTWDLDIDMWNADSVDKDQSYAVGFDEIGELAAYGPWGDVETPTFDSISAAKAHCQAHEDALIADVAREIEEVDHDA